MKAINGCGNTHGLCMRAIVIAFGLAPFLVVSGCSIPLRSKEVHPTPGLEEIFVLHSGREHRESVRSWCSQDRAGFDVYPVDAERTFSFWSLQERAEDGRVVNTQVARVAELRACFGATGEPARQNFYAEVSMGSLLFHGIGECLAMKVDFPEVGLYPVRCQLVLSGLPSPYVGGLLTTNTLTSRAGFGSDTDPPGYTQASIATIRLWKDAARAHP